MQNPHILIEWPLLEAGGPGDDAENAPASPQAGRKPLKKCHSILIVASALLAVLLADSAGAGERPEEPPGWLVGMGYIVAPDPYAGDVQDGSRAIPLVGYIGERLTWLGPYLSYEVVERKRLSVAVGLNVRFQGIDEDITSGPLAGIHARKPALEAGIDAAYGPVRAAVRADVSGRHDGFEISLALGEDWRFADRWRLDGQAGVALQDANLADGVYGIDATETRPGRDIYEPGDALNYQASLDLSRTIGRDWLLFTSVTYEVLDDEISASPIVDQDEQFSAFTGIAFQFGKTSDSTH